MAIGQKKTREAEKLLEGNWKATKAVYDSVERKIAGLFVMQRMEIADAKFKAWFDGKEFFGTYKLDVTKDPKWITIQYDGYTNKPWQGTSFRGVFSVSKDKLIVVTNVERRPKELSSKRTSLNTLMEYERIKEDDKKEEKKN